MFDIKRQKIEQAGVMSLRDVHGNKSYDDEGNALSITLHSPAAKIYQNAKKDMDSAITDILMAGTAKNRSELSIDDVGEIKAEFLAKCTVSFNYFALPEFPELSGRELFKAVYADQSIGHIADQVDMWLAKKANFIEPVATN